jgi:hypothetical protein
MICIDPNSGKYIVVCAEQRVRRKSFALGKFWKQLLREDDDIMQYGDICSKLSDNFTHEVAIQLTFVAVIGFPCSRNMLSGIGLRRGSWGRHLEEGIRRDQKISSIQMTSHNGGRSATSIYQQRLFDVVFFGIPPWSSISCVPLLTRCCSRSRPGYDGGATAKI